jgi:hypothetical protein
MPQKTMTRLTTSLIFASLFLFHGLAASAREAPAIAGVRLGMTSESVLAVLRAKQIAVRIMYQPCLREYLAMHTKVVGFNGPGGHCLQMIQAKYGGGTYLIFFTEDVPHRPGVGGNDDRPQLSLESDRRERRAAGGRGTERHGRQTSVDDCDVVL